MIELSSEFDLAGKSGTTCLYLKFFDLQVHSSTSCLRLKFWSTVAVSQSCIGSYCTHNSAEKFIKEHCLPLEISLKRS